jgi:sporulation protein YlmC with PRC-barrel domain
MNRVTFLAAVVLIGTAAGPALGQAPPTQAPATPPPPGSSQPAPAQAPAGVSQGRGGQADVMIASDSLVGTTVKDAQGKDIGEISKLLIDASQGKVAAAIIRQGGKLGMGGKEISVPWEALRLQRGQNQQLVVTMPQPVLEQAPSGSPASGSRDRKQ